MQFGRKSTILLASLRVRSRTVFIVAGWEVYIFLSMLHEGFYCSLIFILMLAVKHSPHLGAHIKEALILQAIPSYPKLLRNYHFIPSVSSPFAYTIASTFSEFLEYLRESTGTNIEVILWISLDCTNVMLRSPFICLA